MWLQANDSLIHTSHPKLAPELHSHSFNYVYDIVTYLSDSHLNMVKFNMANKQLL